MVRLRNASPSRNFMDRTGDFQKELQAVSVMPHRYGPKDNFEREGMAMREIARQQRDMEMFMMYLEEMQQNHDIRRPRYIDGRP